MGDISKNRRSVLFENSQTLSFEGVRTGFSEYSQNFRATVVRPAGRTLKDHQKCNL